MGTRFLDKKPKTCWTRNSVVDTLYFSECQSFKCECPVKEHIKAFQRHHHNKFCSVFRLTLI